jgi:hypothetical protein
LRSAKLIYGNGQRTPEIREYGFRFAVCDAQKVAGGLSFVFFDVAGCEWPFDQFALASADVRRGTLRIQRAPPVVIVVAEFQFPRSQGLEILRKTTSSISSAAFCHPEFRVSLERSAGYERVPDRSANFDCFLEDTIFVVYC